MSGRRIPLDLCTMASARFCGHVSSPRHRNVIPDVHQFHGRVPSSTQIYEGTNQVQKVVIAREILKEF